MSNKPELSIIVPAYNAQSDIADCLDSLVAQKSSENFEIIVINDGSTDHTPDIVESYAMRHPKIKLISQANAGVSAARNRGIDASHGEYISFVDSDDTVGASPASMSDMFDGKRATTNKYANMDLALVRYVDMECVHPIFDNDYYSKILNTVRRTHPDMAMFGKITINSNDKYIRRHIYKTERVYNQHPADKRVLLGLADRVESANLALYRREFLDAQNLRFPDGIHLDEDILFCMRAVLRAQMVVTVPDVAYLYNRHPNSLSNITDKTMSDTKYSIANIARYSGILYDLMRRPEYAHLYTDWLQRFARSGGGATAEQERYPSHQCGICPITECAGCCLHERNMERISDNVAKYLPTHTR